MTTGERDNASLPDLPAEVAERIVGELPTRGDKVIGCLRTAAVLIKLAVDDDRGLRLAESAGYNLREALEAVVAGRSPVKGGLPAILEAWERYQASADQPGSENAASLRALEDLLKRVAENRDRSSYHAARLLGYLRARTGIDPLSGDRDPVGEYTRLRKEANDALHSESVLEDVSALFDQTVAWFIRMFTPHVVPADVLRSSGRWAFVTGLSDEVWSQLMIRTLELTEGVIDLPIEVADRCRTVFASGKSTRILLLLLGHGDPWERDYVARVAIDALRTVSRDPVDSNFHRLRTRLIDLGYHEAVEITPDKETDGD